MAASTSTTINYALKERYVGQTVKELTFEKSPILDMMPKDEEFSGKLMPWPITYSNPQGFSGSRAGAQNNYSTQTGTYWSLTVGDIADGVSIGNKAMVLSAKDAGAFLEDKAHEIDGMHRNHGIRIEQLLFGMGGGSLGTYSSASGNVITLTNPEDAVKFEVGQTLEAASDDGTAGSDNRRSGSTTVSSVDYSAGTVTLTSAAAISGLTTSDQFFSYGTYLGQSGVDLGIKGFPAWIPSAAPSSTAFYGVDRTTNLTRLGGVRLTSTEYSGLSIEQRIDLLCVKTNMIGGGEVDTIIVHPKKWRLLKNDLEAKGIRAIDSYKNGEAMFGAKAISFTHANGEARIFSSRWCGVNDCFALELDTWKFFSAGPIAGPISGDGNKLLREATADNYEYRVVTYPCFACQCPGKNGYTTLA